MFVSHQYPVLPLRIERNIQHEHCISPILKFAPGDEIEMLMPGGAGFGDVGERERELVVRDVELGYVSPEGAARDYGVELKAKATRGREAGPR